MPFVTTPGVAVLVGATAGAGAWYDYRRATAMGMVAGLKLTATSFGRQAYTGVIMLADTVVSTELQAPLARVVIGAHTLFEEGWKGSRREAAHLTPERA
jgi:hypothetical protein